MPTTFFALGTNSEMPNERRETCCHALLHEDMLLIFDFGTGAMRLASPELAPKFARAAECFIFMSGFTLDRAAGLAWLPRIFPGRKVTIAGPGEAFGMQPLEKSIARIVSPETCGAYLGEMPLDIELAELKPGSNSFPRFGLGALPLLPDGGSIGYRFDSLFACAVDTPATETARILAEGAAMLLHECRLDEPDLLAACEGDDPPRLTQSSFRDAATIALESRVEMLALSYLNPAYREGRLRRLEQSVRRLFEWSLLLHDTQHFDLIE